MIKVQWGKELLKDKNNSPFNIPILRNKADNSVVVHTYYKTDENGNKIGGAISESESLYVSSPPYVATILLGRFSNTISCVCPLYSNLPLPFHCTLLKSNLALSIVQVKVYIYRR